MRVLLIGNFTCKPVALHLQASLHEGGMEGHVDAIDFDQIFSVLLGDNGALNGIDICVILVDLAKIMGSDARTGTAEMWFEQLSHALETASARFECGFLLVAVPRPQGTIDPRVSERAATLFRKLSTSHVAVSHITPEEIGRNNTAWDDHRIYGNEVELSVDILFSECGHLMLAHTIARAICAAKRSVRKVLVVDCDNTLWLGNCGEDPLRIEVTDEHRTFQAFLLDQTKRGRLLCLCSKNNEADVLAVFSREERMVLKLDDVVAYRINWRPKSENLKSIAQELDLRTDSFIFIDDEEYECSEIDSVLPEVCTIRVPTGHGHLYKYIQSIWELDLPQQTTEDSERTRYYRDVAKRKQLARSSLTFQDYIAALGVVVTSEPLMPKNIKRACQLMVRTTQFNLNGRKWDEGQLMARVNSGEVNADVFYASDRLGDYGLVGAVIYSCADKRLIIHALNLSCRAIGKGIEDQLLDHLSRTAECESCGEIQFEFLYTGRNAVAERFVTSAQHKSGHKHARIVFTSTGIPRFGPSEVPASASVANALPEIFEAS